MKRISVLLPVVLVAAYLFFRGNSTPSVMGLAQLPDEGRLLILSLVTSAVTFALLQLSEVLKVDLSGYANVIAAALAPVLVTLFESYLQLIPPVFDDIVLSIIHIIVLLAGSLGVFWVIKRSPAPSLTS